MSRIVYQKKGESHEEFLAREKVEKRIERQTPRAIARRNYGKRSGILSFAFSEDGSEVQINNYRKLRPAEQMLLAMLAADGGKLYDTHNGGMAAIFKLQDPAKIRAKLKLATIPERCERCKGEGEIENPIPAPSLPSMPDWHKGETREAFDARRKKAEDDYCAKHNVDTPSWASIVRCPICRGTGRAVQLESVEEDAS